MKLRAYQQEGVSFLLSHKGALLADDMGLGKTATALNAASAFNPHAAFHTVIVCPAYVVGVWVNELKKWWPNAVPLTCRGIKAVTINDPDIDVAICNYSVLHAWADTLATWEPDIVIFDECHYLMSDKSQRSKAARRVSANAMHRWGLSGTPLTNRPKDLWNVIETLWPTFFGSFFKYALKYCNAHKVEIPGNPPRTVWDFNGKSNLPDLHRRLSYIMLRRTKADVALELPPKTRQVVDVEVATRGRMPVEMRAADMRRSLDAAADAKLPQALELILSHLEAGSSVVAFTWRKAVAADIVDSARARGHAAELITGDVPVTKRDDIIARARGASGGLLAATIDSAGVGIDLSYASVAVFVELDWGPHKLLQAEARLHRYGAQNPVLIQYILARGTVDELIADVVLQRLDMFSEAVGDVEGMRELAGKEEDILHELFMAVERSKVA